ncbi:MAG: hypothetical protein CSA74_09460 [Rhodobacterales bacterium]|nr:MAG: hypothetical protein CSA74_09460 [Rhodobacterales bacterium]
MRRRYAPLLAACLAVAPAFAEEEVDDKTFLENLLQDKLSAAGRRVEVTGFAGALSSQATMQRLTISDDEGVWLSIEGAQLDWTRSALLVGRLDVQSLSAKRIEIVRAPVAVSDGPEPAASAFSLPELPVSISIGKISAETLVLGEPLLGVGASFRLEGGGQLEDGAGDARIALQRIDGEQGNFAIAAGYSNETRVLKLDLDLDEGAGGIVSRLTGLPGGAPLSFELKGTGPVDDYAAELTLATNGSERIGGRVTLLRKSPDAPLDFTAKLEGDPTALLAEEYRAFFGKDVRLAVAGRQDTAGMLDLATLDIGAEALTLSGSALIGPGGWPERVALAGKVAAPGGGAVLLPLGGDPTSVEGIALSFSHDAAQGEDWRAEVTLDKLSRPDLKLETARLIGRGQISADENGVPVFGGHVDVTALGLSGAPDSPAAAIGPDLTGSFDLVRTSGETLRFENLALDGGDFGLTGDVTLDTLVDQLELAVSGKVVLETQNLARFAPAAGQDLSGAARLAIAGEAALPGGPFDVEITGATRDIGIGNEQFDRLFAGESQLALAAARGAEGTEIKRLELLAPGAGLSGTGWLAATGSQLALRFDMSDVALLDDRLSGPVALETRALQEGTAWNIALDATGPGGALVDFDGRAETGPRGLEQITTVRGNLGAGIERLAAFAGVAGMKLTGAARLDTAASYDLGSGAFSLEGSGATRDIGIGNAQFDRLFAGESRLAFAAARNDEGTRIDRLTLAAPGASLSGTGWLAATGSQLALRVDMPDAELLDDGLSGPVALEARALQQESPAWDLTLDATGPGGTVVDFDGRAETGPDGPEQITAVSGKLGASAERLAAFAGVAGVKLTGAARLDTAASYDLGSGAFSLEGSGTTQGLGLGLGNADRLFGGASQTGFALRRDGAGTLFVDRFTLRTPELDIAANGSTPQGQPRVDLTARLRDLGVFVPQLPGAFTAKGTAALGDAGWRLDISGDGPGGTAHRISGTLAADAATADLMLRGRAPFAFANDFIAPRALSGMAQYDLALSGPFALGSLSGTIRSDGARMALPAVGISLSPMTARVTLGGNQASLELSAGVSSGGRITLRGPVSLNPPHGSNLSIALISVGLRDASLYDLTVDGNLAVTGPLTGGASITGGLRLGKVELRIPETGFGVDGSLDGLRHVGSPRDVRATQARAGLTGKSGGGGGSGTAYGLGITIDAPTSVFIRGRGLDAELGGRITLGGTTANMVTTGGVQLIRGRLDILGNRLDLTEGSVSLRGGLDPALKLLAVTQVEDVIIRISIEGSASDPSVKFTSSPDLPEDEILARLVFGRGLDQISAFQALKLASAVATLSGQGGSGTIGRLREDFGLDDLDVTTDESGELEMRAGTRISDSIYTDVTVGADGQAEVNLNLTLTPDITARGSVNSDGETGIGVYFEKDY